MTFWNRSLLTLAASLTLHFTCGADTGAPLQGEWQIPNLEIAKRQIRAYVTSGRYEEEVRLVAGQARQFLEERLRQPVQGRAAIVFDVDETCLSNYRHIASLDFGYQPQQWNLWVAQAQAPPLRGVLELYQYARSRGLAVVFLTGRSPDQREKTEQNLRQAGFDEWTQLILKPADSSESGAEFKARQRQQLSQAGLEILVNVGDQASDLAGGYSESVFKLPNPMYWLP
ncbi:MAG: HAD family acid phosphatase [Candidatus Eremiobacteraeota bacterium]|nr:HAD family acid phosphatase [Candidatus Eremiobacteraeota bacterium]